MVLKILPFHKIENMLTEILQEFEFNLRQGTILMPNLEYTIVAWLLRLASIGVACYLWYLSIKLFKKNKWLIPGIMNFLTYFILFIACFEINFIAYQCESMNCLHTDREMYFGIMGVCVYKTEGRMGRCIYKDSERQLWKATEMRLWGGFIGALPFRVEVIHKLSGMPVQEVSPSLKTPDSDPNSGEKSEPNYIDANMSLDNTPQKE